MTQFDSHFLNDRNKNSQHNVAYVNKAHIMYSKLIRCVLYGNATQISQMANF